MGLLGTSFTETVHAEQEQHALPTCFQDPQEDFWAWDCLFAGYDGARRREASRSTRHGVAGYGARVR